jgi:hypothetical protein
VTPGLAEQVAITDPRLLLPPRAADRPDRLTLDAAAGLPGSGAPRFLAVAVDSEGRRYLLPLVDDDVGLRRARPGDEFGAAVLALMRDDNVGSEVLIRAGRAPAGPSAAAPETHSADVPGREVFAVGDRRVCLHLEPSLASAPGRDVVGDLERSDTVPMLGWVGEAWIATPDGGVVGPVARASVLPDGVERLPARLQGLVADHLRGADDGQPTLQTALLWGRALGSFHHELAREAVEGGGVLRADADDIRRWRREAMDVVAEAAVLAEGEPAERLRSGRAVIRGAMEDLVAAEGAILVSALPVRGPEAFVWSGTTVLLDPIVLDPPTDEWRSPVRDVASALRAADHIARSVHRRFIGSGYPAPIERMASWFEAVRSEFLEGYREASGQLDGQPLFDERLLLAFEVEAECRSLSDSSRVAPAGRSVSEAALAALLTPG